MIGRERVGAILAAAGSGERLGEPKQWLVLRGRSLLRRTASTLAASGVVDELVAAVPAGASARAAVELEEVAIPWRTVEGGASRAASVRSAFDALESCDVIVVHDGSRPFAEPALVRRVAEEAALHGAAVAAVPATDTVKRVRDGVVSETIDRREIFLAQTPQAFRRELLRRGFEAIADADLGAVTDESKLIELLGLPVKIVPGDPDNVKITWKEDWLRAQRAHEAPFVVGHGYDAHPFDEGRRLILGGVELEGQGLKGHSDADVCCHAVASALLGAAGLGDLGAHFPDTDPRFAGASSISLLKEVAALVQEAAFVVGNCDVTIVARRPAIAPHVASMRARLADALDVAPAQISVKASSGNGLGFEGRGEGISALATCVLYRRGA